jgi:stringent starvation protein B
MAGLSDNAGSSTRPYLVRALHDWCTDNGFTPYIAVHVGAHVQVPMEYVKNNEIVLNVSFEATSNLRLGNDAIEFKARFGGVTREIHVPIESVVAIYARENGQGMAFPMPTAAASAGADDGAATPAPEPSRGGLRLASSEPAASEAATDKGVVPRDQSRDPSLEKPGDEPPPPPGGGDTPRPTLKRVK